MRSYQEMLELYDNLVDQCPDFQRKGKTMPYTSANGYMFSLLNKDAELGIRISKEDGKAFMEKYDATEFRSHGAKMRDYVKIPEHLLDNTDLLVDLLIEGHKHVMSLPPK